MSSLFRRLDSDHQLKDGVIAMIHSSSVYRVTAFETAISEILGKEIIEQLIEEWTKKGHSRINPYLFKPGGINCEVLAPGSKGWQKGVIRAKLCLEFYPHEAKEQELEEENSNIESPLDEIRQMVDE
jgi:hypothetical protein